MDDAARIAAQRLLGLGAPDPDEQPSAAAKFVGALSAGVITGLLAWIFIDRATALILFGVWLATGIFQAARIKRANTER